MAALRCGSVDKIAGSRIFGQVAHCRQYVDAFTWTLTLAANAGRAYYLFVLRQASEEDAVMDGEHPSKLVRWPILRLRPGHENQVFLLSGQFVRVPTHYFKRTIPCVGDQCCPLCEVLPSRSFWYLPAAHCSNRQPVLLELSASASAALEQNAKLLGGTLTAGLRLRLWRDRAKSSIKGEVLEGCVQQSDVSFTTWGSALMAVFLLPAVKPDESVESYAARTLEVRTTRARLVADQIKASSQRRR